MAQLPGIDVKLIRLNPEWSVENAASTPLAWSQNRRSVTVKVN